MADRARLLSVSAPHAASWLSVIPSPALGLHLEPNQASCFYKVVAGVGHLWWFPMSGLLRESFGPPLASCHYMHSWR